MRDFKVEMQFTEQLKVKKKKKKTLRKMSLNVDFLAETIFPSPAGVCFSVLMVLALGTRAAMELMAVSAGHRQVWGCGR